MGIRRPSGLNGRPCARASSSLPPGAAVASEALAYRMVVPPRGHWSTLLSVVPAVGGIGPAAPFEHPDADGLSRAAHAGRSGWRRSRCCRWVTAPSRTLRRSYDDLGALRIEDPEHPDRVVGAACAMVHDLFGRDSLWPRQCRYRRIRPWRWAPCRPWLSVRML